MWVYVIDALVILVVFGGFYLWIRHEEYMREMDRRAKAVTTGRYRDSDDESVPTLVKCLACGEEIEVASRKRPIEVMCPKCGTTHVLSKTKMKEKSD